MAYKTARFIAERVLPDAKPRRRHGNSMRDIFTAVKTLRPAAGRLSRWGRLRDHWLPPYRSNLHFSIDPESHDQFVIPAFGLSGLK